ncbi:hypothetical protein O3M35_010563 [Rhynocoris fuscipes]|uniref:AMP-dependent synthetase/ligase domain-containing protein n=1 Tax=Rhynocoris fuscipes TaxID=488301 RepID=A0AAW1D6G6_9HEMI
MTDTEGNNLFLSGPPPKILDPNISAAEVIFSAMKKHDPESTVQVELETGRELTYGELLTKILSVVQGLKEEGVEENTMIAVVTFNSQEAHIITLAAFFLGATVAPIDPALTAEEMGFLMTLVSPYLVYTECGKTLRKTEAAIAALKSTPLIVVPGKQNHQYIPFQELIQPPDPDFRPSITKPDEHTILILFTSGTTGLPKGVMLSDLYLLNSLIAPQDRDIRITYFLASPLFWLSGVLLLFTTLSLGGKMIFVRGPVKDKVILSAFQKYQVNTTLLSPSTWQGLLVSPYRNVYDISSIVMALSGGAALRAESALKMEKELFQNRIPILQGYGMTEIGVASFSPADANKPGSIGILKTGYSCKIEDVETGELLGPDKEGEVCIKCPYIMRGYYNNPEATAASFDEDGWFRTGDIGYYDEDGYLYIVDRMKELIKYRSYHVSQFQIRVRV